MKKAVILLSGGLDSTTTLYLAREKGFKTFALIFDYGQRHRREVARARKIARISGTPYRVMKINFPWKGSSLVDKRLPVPLDRREISSRIPSTYVPGRNIIFLSCAAAYAEVLGARAIFIGANAIDYSGYPDCRPRFYRSFQEALAEGLKAGVEGKRIKIHTPFLQKTKAQIIQEGLRLGVPYSLTWSCYRGGKRPCGRCDSCLLRGKGFARAGVSDPSISSSGTRGGKAAARGRAGT
ncbi:MAG: 7-cyano-7-deazaguanine synthase QueC [Candidatus Omnitrophota bacterium]